MHRDFNIEFLSASDFGQKLGIHWREVVNLAENGHIIRCYNNKVIPGLLEPEYMEPKYLYLWSDAIYYWWVQQGKKLPGEVDWQYKFMDYDFYLSFARELVEKMDKISAEHQSLQRQAMKDLANAW